MRGSQFGRLVYTKYVHLHRALDLEQGGIVRLHRAAPAPPGGAGVLLLPAAGESCSRCRG